MFRNIGGDFVICVSLFMMGNLSNILRKIGNVWMMVAIVYIVLSYCLNIVVSNEPFIQRVLSLLNVWNLFFAFSLVCPGYFFTEIAKMIKLKRKD